MSRCPNPGSLTGSRVLKRVPTVLRNRFLKSGGAMLGAHRQSGYLCFFFLNNKKNPHFNSISLPPLWGNLYRKSTHLWRGRVNTPLPQPAQRKMWPCRLLGWWPVERGMGTGLFRAGLGGDPHTPNCPDKSDSGCPTGVPLVSSDAFSSGEAPLKECGPGAVARLPLPT